MVLVLLVLLLLPVLASASGGGWLELQFSGSSCNGRGSHILDRCSTKLVKNQQAVIAGGPAVELEVTCMRVQCPRLQT